MTNSPADPEPGSGAASRGSDGPVGSAPTRFICRSCGAVFRRELRYCPADGSLLAALTEDPLMGKVLAGRYAVQSLLGEGGMARVYFGVDADGGPGRYAIKVLFGELSADPRQYERFVREAARASAFDHPNLVRVVDFGSTAGDQPFVVMEFVAGRSLSSILRREAPLAEHRIVSLISDLCRALEHVHGRGIVHRDVKAGNVIVTQERRTREGQAVRLRRGCRAGRQGAPPDDQADSHRDAVLHVPGASSVSGLRSPGRPVQPRRASLPDAVR